MTQIKITHSNQVIADANIDTTSGFTEIFQSSVPTEVLLKYLSALRTEPNFREITVDGYGFTITDQN